MMETNNTIIYKLKIQSAVETIFNNNLLEGWNFTRTAEKFVFEKDNRSISVEYEAVYFLNSKGNSYKINNPFFITEFKETLNKFIK